VLLGEDSPGIGGKKSAAKVRASRGAPTNMKGRRRPNRSVVWSESQPNYNTTEILRELKENSG